MAALALRLYQKTDPNVDFGVLLENKKSKNSLLFQAGTVATLSQPETDAIRGDHYGRLLDAYACLGVLQVCPRISWEGENTQQYLVVVTKCVRVCTIHNSAIYKIQEIDIISLHSMRLPNYKAQEEESWIKEMKKLLGNESFFFSVSTGNAEALDLTLCAQRRFKTNRTDNRYFWNRMLHLHLKRFGVDCQQWLTKVMCGSVEFSSIYMNNHTPKILIISRLSCERAGTRFMVRGVNDGGHVANFVETEQMISIDTMDDLVLSYIQTRGTVPLFWEQPGLNVGSHKVKMSREPEVSVQAFQKHMRFLRERYGQQVVINLLGTGVTGRSQGEAALSHVFQIQHINCPWSKDSPHIVFDFHQECKGGHIENLSKKLVPRIQEEMETFGYFCSRKGQVQSLQRGTMRTNCLDCLDRTNRVQTFLGLDCLNKMLEDLGVANNGVIVQRFTTKLEEMWKDNGNRISQIYAGTGALQGSKLIDGARSAARTFQNNLLDSSKQEAIDIILHGNLLNNYLAALSRSLLPTSYLYAPISVLRQLCQHSSEYTESIPLRVAVGTYNVNGGKHFRSLAYKHLSLDDWLLDSKKNAVQSSLVDTTPEEENKSIKTPDVFAIGFEEIVDLNATNIVQNTQWSENAASWGKELQKVISRDEKFVMVTWSQLVGVALFVFVNEKHANHVRHVSVESVKTGMQGATGNKGGVGIRLVVRNTSMAFVCSHFAAGQKEVNERNNDYDSIARKLIFPLGMPLWAHDYVFWCGDFNYRINLTRDEVVDYVQRQEWSVLLQYDQLKLSFDEGKCFKGFVEGDINFAPTYKYDLFSDDYDTSDKLRIPAWTDRVLFWRRQYAKDKDNPNWSPGRIVHYGRAELKQSDHRPVLAVFDVEGCSVIDSKLTNTYESVVASLGPSDCTVVVQVRNLPAGIDADSVFDDETLEAVQEAMGTVGLVVLVRFVDNKIWFTFSDSQTALKAIACSPLQIKGHELEVKLKTEAWREQLEEELALCGDTTVPLTEESLDIIDSDDAVFRIRNIEGALEELYQSQSREEDIEVECSEEFEQQQQQQRALLQQSKPPPSRPTPSRPPPPRPTPPGSAPSSPAVSRTQSHGPKVKVITKPTRPAQLSRVVSQAVSSNTLDHHIEESSILPVKPAQQIMPDIPPRTPSQESPIKTSPLAEAVPVTSSLFGVPPSMPASSSTVDDEKPFVSPFGAPPPLPDNCPPEGSDSTDAVLEKASVSLFGVPPSMPTNLPSCAQPPLSIKDQFNGEPLGPPPCLPASGTCTDSPISEPPSGPPPSLPPSLPTNGPSSLPPKEPPRHTPARSLPPVPSRAGTGPPPPVPSRNLPPVPARNLPRVPPRN
nr:synaptojanin-1-like isoform X2 [Procambarus clarkii]